MTIVTQELMDRMAAKRRELQARLSEPRTVGLAAAGERAIDGVKRKLAKLEAFLAKTAREEPAR